MASGIGSRHSPDHYAVTSHTDAAASSVVAAAEPPSAEAVAEMTWLCSMIGCALSTAFAPAATSTPAATTTAATAERAPLPTHLRVSLRDGRMYTGRLHCVDAAANLILSHATQLAGEISGVQVGGFTIGQVLIAWRLVLKIEKQGEPIAATKS